MTCVQDTKSFPEKSTTPKVQPRTSATSNLPKVSLLHLEDPSIPELLVAPKTSSVRSRTPPLQDFYLPEVFSILEVSNFKSEAPNISLLRSPPTFILPTFITCNASLSARSYGQWCIPQPTIPTTQSLQQIQHVQIVQLQQPVNFVSMSTFLLGIYNPPSPRRRGSLPWPWEHTHHHYTKIFLFQSIITLAASCAS